MPESGKQIIRVKDLNKSFQALRHWIVFSLTFILRSSCPNGRKWSREVYIHENFNGPHTFRFRFNQFQWRVD